jgi:hypothetical protein
MGIPKGKETVGFVPFGLWDSRADDSPGAYATIDHSDIRGSEPHGHDPSGAASHETRGLGSETVPHRIVGGFSFSWPLHCHRLCCPFTHSSLGYAAVVTGCCFSTDTPMAQMKPSSSRPTAVMI